MYVGSNEVIGAALGSQSGGKLILQGAIIWGRQYSITKSLTNVTIDNNATSIYYKEKYEATLSCNSGKQILPGYVKVVMGDTDISSTAYDESTNKIVIAEVTGNLTISAEAATIPAEYKPVKYIQVTSKSSANAIRLEYVPNNKTKLVLDVNPIEGYPNLLYGTINPNTAASASNPAFQAYIKITNAAGNMQFGTINHASNNNLRLKTGKRVTFTCDKGKFTFEHNTAGVVTKDFSDTATWRSAAKVRIFGYYMQNPTYNYWGTGKIYRATISEEGTMLQDYVSVKRLSDGQAGLYDVTNGVYIGASAYSYPT